MSGKIAVLVKFQIADGRLEEIKEICQKAIEIARTKDSGTLSFNQYINAGNSIMVSLETYRDSQALLTHIDNATENVQRVAEFTTNIQVEIFGDVSDQVKDTFEAFNPAYYKHHSGL